jgi:sugar O-acyltransferase (sialic acid O-acetyltransferase NeuD family)
MSKVVIFGCGKIAEVAFQYLTNDSAHEIVAFTVDGEYLKQTKKYDRPVVPFSDVERSFPCHSHDMLVAIGYHDLNRVRARKCGEARAKGYRLISYMCSRASNFGSIGFGDNCLILDNVVLQPGARIGSNVFLWSGNHIGHHASIGDHCYLSGQVIISGSTVIEPYCYIGVNATIGHEITVGAESFIGAGALVIKNAPAKSVYIEAETPRFRLDSDSFLRLTKMR